MSIEIFDTDYGNVHQLIDKNYSFWKLMISQVVITRIANNIIASVKHLHVGNCVAIYPLQEYWHDRAYKLIALIHLECCDYLGEFLDTFHEPVELGNAPKDRLSNASTNLSFRQV
jgi:hypothetical protein